MHLTKVRVIFAVVKSYREGAKGFSKGAAQIVHLLYRGTLIAFHSRSGWVCMHCWRLTSAVRRVASITPRSKSKSKNAISESVKGSTAD